jgi:hypothetical protein
VREAGWLANENPTAGGSPETGPEADLKAMT